MKYIKYLEYYLEKDSYLIKSRYKNISGVRPIDILKYLKLDTDLYYNGDETKYKDNPYHVDADDFIREIFVGKKVTCAYINNNIGNGWVEGIVQDVGIYAYRELYIKLKIDDKWHIVNNSNIISLEDYDADNKPLHQEIKIAKQASIFNI